MSVFTYKYGHDLNEFECDWLKECVPQNWESDTNCDTMQLIFHGQTLIKFIFKSNLWHNMSFVPQFSLNFGNFLKILHSLEPCDQLHSISSWNFEVKSQFEILSNYSHIWWRHNL